MAEATMNKGHIQVSWEFLGTENDDPEAAPGLIQEDSSNSPYLFQATKPVCEIYNLYNLGIINIIDMRWSFHKVAGLDFFFNVIVKS